MAFAANIKIKKSEHNCFPGVFFMKSISLKYKQRDNYFCAKLNVYHANCRDDLINNASLRLVNLVLKIF